MDSEFDKLADTTQALMHRLQLAITYLEKAAPYTESPEIWDNEINRLKAQLTTLITQPIPKLPQ